MKADKAHPFNVGFYNSKISKYEKGVSSQGVIYKNYDDFNSKSIAVCYIPELTDDLYSYFDFLKIAKGNSDIAVCLFETVDWQSPEILYEELMENGEVA